MAVFCPKCGTQNSDTDKFCQSCGAQLEGAAPAEQIQTDYSQPAYSAPAQEQTQSGFGVSGGTADKKKMNPIPLIIAAAALVVIIVIAVILKSVFSYEKIDAKDLFDVSFSGPNGYGICYAQLDIDPVLAYTEYKVEMEDYSQTKAFVIKNDSDDDDELTKKKKVEYSNYFSDDRKDLLKAYKKSKDKSDAKDKRDALLKVDKKKNEFKLKVKPSKENGLKNGDKVTLEVDFDEEYLKENKIKLENTSWEVEVKGLTEAITIDDAFAGFKPKFEGLDSEGSCSYDSYGGDYKFVYIYNEGSNYGLSNGDKLKFTASCETYDIHYLDNKDEKKGFWFANDGKLYVWPYESSNVSKEYTVEGLKGLEVVDPAEEIELEYSGASPFLDVTAKVKSGSKYADYISVGIEDSYNDRYKAGDTIKVRVYGYYSLKEAGYKLKDVDDEGYSYVDITIPETAPHYATAAEAPDANAALEETFANAETTLKQYIQGNKYLRDGVSLDDKAKSVSLKAVSNYYSMNDITDYSSLGWGAAVNRISRVYKVDVTLDNGGKQSFYIVAYVDNIINTDGTYSSTEDVDYTFYEKNRDAIEAVEGLAGYTVNAFGNGGEASTESKADESKADESKADESKADESKADESAADSKADESKAESAAESKADSSSEEKVP